MRVIVRSVLLRGIFVIVILILCSCSAAIEDSAADSASSILAVFFEYIFALAVLLFSFLHRLIRSLSVATIVLGIIAEIGVVNLSVSPMLFIIIGVALLTSFLKPINPYYPRVIISKNVKKVAETWTKDREKIESRHFVKEFLVELVLGIILLLIEYTVFSN